jgi:MarR family transcriptional regulator, transcriptional regulator for hemolysin
MTEFKPDLLSILHDVARLGRVLADKRARMHDMTRAQWVMMLWLERKPGISQKELSDLLEVEPITVARLVDRLEQRRMVERRADPADRRIWRLHLKPEAVPLLEEIKAERAEIAELIVEGVDEATLATMLQGLLRMRATLCAEARGGGGRRTEPAREERADAAREKAKEIA